MSTKIILVTGPARSGKSEWAETLAKAQQKPVIYLATSVVDAQDSDWCERVRSHQQRRPCDWQTLEVPRDLPSAIASLNSGYCVLVDSLGTWVANLLDLESGAWEQNLEELGRVLQGTSLSLIFVAEETGWGVIPAYPSGRVFRDRLGFLVRQLAQLADLTYLVMGGHVLNLTQLGEPLDKCSYTNILG